MWANEEVADLVKWLREFNRNQADQRKIGFYGLDVYSLWDSLYAVIGYLRRAHPDAFQRETTPPGRSCGVASGEGNRSTGRSSCRIR